MRAVVAEMAGGLGNQLFQWAFAHALAKRTRRRLVIDGNVQQAGVPRRYMLGRLGIQASEDIPVASDIYNVISSGGYETVGPDSSGSVRVRGMWMGEGPWADRADEIRETLPRAPVFMGAVAVHVRRTDFLSYESPMEVLGAEYYEAALAQVPSLDVLVFSDDPAWCRRRLSVGRVVDVPDPIEAFTLMASCRHHVIANSSFSWWAAWLAEHPGQVVVAPKNWLRNNTAVTKQIVPNRWVMQ